MSQQTATAIGGDGTGDNAPQVRRPVIQAGTVPGENVRLGYDQTSQIYGTSSHAGGPIDTFTGIGRPDPNSTKIDGASQVAAQQTVPGGYPVLTRPGAPNGGSGLDVSAIAANIPRPTAGTDVNANNIARPAPPVASSPAVAPSVAPAASAAVAANNAAADVQAAQRSADSDVASILNEDPRSAAGTAARNARINLGGIKSPRSRYGAGGASPYQEALGALIERANGPVQNAVAEGQTNTVQAGDTEREGLIANAENARTAAENQRTAAAPYGSIAARNDQHRYGSVASRQDPNNYGSVASRQANQNPAIPKEAAEFLRQNPNLRDHFDAKYGAGSAAQLLGSQGGQ